MATAYWIGFALGAVGSAVIGWATVATALYLRTLKGSPFTELVMPDELEGRVRKHGAAKRVITCIAKLPSGMIVISGR